MGEGFGVVFGLGFVFAAVFGARVVVFFCESQLTQRRMSATHAIARLAALRFDVI
jgi:hypothetical protein